MDVVETGEAGQELAEDIHYDAIIIDEAVLGKSGLEVTRSLRQENILTPILMTGRRNRPDDIINGLNMGADDYLIKPYNLSELNARVRAIIRRSPMTYKPQLKAGDIVMDQASHQVWYKGTEIQLSRMEFSVLELLMRTANMVVPRFSFEEHVWDLRMDAKSNIVDNHISSLRAKFEEVDPDANPIETVRGVGYKLRIPKASKSRAIAPILIFLIGLILTLQPSLDWIDAIT